MVEQEGRGQKLACQFQRDPARLVEWRLHPGEYMASMKGKSHKPGKLLYKDKVGTGGLPENMTDLYDYFFFPELGLFLHCILSLCLSLLSLRQRCVFRESLVAFYHPLVPGICQALHLCSLDPEKAQQARFLSYCHARDGKSKKLNDF